MSQIKVVLSTALLFVSTLCLGEGRIDSQSAIKEAPAGVFVVPDIKKGTASVYELKSIDPRVEAAKAGELSENEVQDLLAEAKVNIPKTAKKIGEIPLASKLDREMTSVEACGRWRWGWGGGWGYTGFGFGYGWGGGWGWGGCGGWGAFGWGGMAFPVGFVSSGCGWFF